MKQRRRVAASVVLGTLPDDVLAHVVSMADASAMLTLRQLSSLLRSHCSRALPQLLKRTPAAGFVSTLPPQHQLQLLARAYDVAARVRSHAHIDSELRAVAQRGRCRAFSRHQPHAELLTALVIAELCSHRLFCSAAHTAQLSGACNRLWTCGSGRARWICFGHDPQGLTALQPLTNKERLQRTFEPLAKAGYDGALAAMVHALPRLPPLSQRTMLAVFLEVMLAAEESYGAARTSALVEDAVRAGIFRSLVADIARMRDAPTGGSYERELRAHEPYSFLTLRGVFVLLRLSHAAAALGVRAALDAGIPRTLVEYLRHRLPGATDAGPLQRGSKEALKVGCEVLTQFCRLKGAATRAGREAVVRAGALPVLLEISRLDDCWAYAAKVLIAMGTAAERPLEHCELPPSVRMRVSVLHEGRRFDVTLWAAMLDLRVAVPPDVRALKKQVATATGVCEEGQRLFAGDVELESEEQSLAAYGVGAGNTLRVERRPEVVVRFVHDSNLLRFSFRPECTTAQLREFIYRHRGHAPQRQTLYTIMPGRLLREGKLVDFGVKAGSKVFCAVRSSTLMVEFLAGPQPLKINVHQECTIAQLKVRIAAEGGFSPEMQSLVHGGKRLPDHDGATELLARHVNLANPGAKVFCIRRCEPAARWAARRPI